MSDKVSIIVPLYNAEEHLKRCVGSLLDQTYRNIEILLVNDGSTDGSLELCEDFERKDRRVRVLTQENQGPASARNFGIDCATGDYIAFADADDFVFPDAVYSMLTEIESSQADAVRMMCEIEKNGTRRPERIISSRVYEGRDIDIVTEAIVTGKMAAYTYLLIIRSDKIPKSVRFNPNLRMMEDTCFYVDLLQHLDSIKISDIVTYLYVINDSGVTHNVSKFADYAENVLEINGHFNNILSGRKFISEMNAVHAKIISNYTFVLRSDHKELADFDAFISNLHSHGYREIFKASNLRFMPFRNVILAYSISKGANTAAFVIDSLSMLRCLAKRRKK